MTRTTGSSCARRVIRSPSAAFVRARSTSSDASTGAGPGIFGDRPAWAPGAIGISLIATAVALVPSLASAGLPYARTGLAVATGAVALAVLLVAAPGPDFFMAVWRAEIYGGLSGRDGALEELRSILSTARTPAERRRAEWSWRTYGPR